MATIIDFPQRRTPGDHWAAVVGSIEEAAQTVGLTPDQTRHLVQVMRIEWDEFFVSATTYELPERSIKLQGSLSSDDIANLKALNQATAQDAADRVWLHMIGLFQVLAWERANALMQGARLLSER